MSLYILGDFVVLLFAVDAFDPYGVFFSAIVRYESLRRLSGGFGADGHCIVYTNPPFVIMLG